jgi:hypothetical protein
VLKVILKRSGTPAVGCWPLARVNNGQPRVDQKYLSVVCADAFGIPCSIAQRRNKSFSQVIDEEAVEANASAYAAHYFRPNPWSPGSSFGA